MHQMPRKNQNRSKKCTPNKNSVSNSNQVIIPPHPFSVAIISNSNQFSTPQYNGNNNNINQPFTQNGNNQINNSIGSHSNTNSFSNQSPKIRSLQVDSVINLLNFDDISDPSNQSESEYTEKDYDNFDYPEAYF